MTLALKIDQLAILSIQVLYAACIVVLFVYSLVQVHLLWKYKNQPKKERDTIPKLPKELPFVSIQLPIYNELYVVERLLDCVSRIKWPKDRLEIQVLDDSDDETVDRIATQVRILKQHGYDITHIRREERTGFKAGALQNGLEIAKGEFIAVFDADFLPRPDFLLQTIPYFNQPQTGMVQTRWEHLNEGFSMLTRLQAFALNAHFYVEQGGRDASNYFINFNGTAGIWRKSCIIDAGGWQADTLSEDLDLSYRAQQKGWKFRYLEEIGSPAELPITVSAYKTQQYRWNKGSAECVRKNLKSLLKQHNIPFKTRLHGFFHLLNSSMFICLLLMALLSLPLLFIKQQLNSTSFFLAISLLGTLAFIILASVYFLVSKQFSRKPLFSFVQQFPAFMVLSLGMSLHNSLAVIEGYSGKKTPFVRTPKFNNTATDGKDNKYVTRNFQPLCIAETLLGFYFIVGVVSCILLKDYGFLPFHLMLATGLLWVAWFSFKR